MVVYCDNRREDFVVWAKWGIFSVTARCDVDCLAYLFLGGGIMSKWAFKKWDGGHSLD